MDWRFAPAVCLVVRAMEYHVFAVSQVFVFFLQFFEFESQVSILVVAMISLWEWGLWEPV